MLVFLRPRISLGPGRARALCGGRDSGLDVTSESLQKVHDGLQVETEKIVLYQGTRWMYGTGVMRG